MVDEECPHCDTQQISPYDADDLTFLVEKRGRRYVVLRSRDTAEHTPDYMEIGEFATRELAAAYVIEVEGRSETSVSGTDRKQIARNKASDNPRNSSNRGDPAAWISVHPFLIRGKILCQPNAGDWLETRTPAQIRKR